MVTGFYKIRIHFYFIIRYNSALFNLLCTNVASSRRHYDKLFCAADQFGFMAVLATFVSMSSSTLPIHMYLGVGYDDSTIIDDLYVKEWESRRNEFFDSNLRAYCLDPKMLRFAVDALRLFTRVDTFTGRTNVPLQRSDAFIT